MLTAALRRTEVPQKKIYANSAQNFDRPKFNV